MPFLVASVTRANEVFSALDGWEPDGLIETIGEAETVIEMGESLGVFDVLDSDQADALKVFLAKVPESLDAAIVGAVRNALSRGLRSQLTWQPGYEFELRLWEVSDGPDGLLNVHVVTPHPDEPTMP
jgi:hypothetical protein